MILYIFEADYTKPKPMLTLASTTSLQDSGLLDAVVLPFEKKYNCKVKVIAVGTGQAIQLAKDGNADVLLVHDRFSEEEFIAQGYGEKRLEVMYNDFFIVGPKNDPAGIRNLKPQVADKALEAFKKIYETKSLFISRGDDSGTHKRELSLWSELGLSPSGSWYIESGGGMEVTLRIANEKVAYTLCDRATWFFHRRKFDKLDVFVKGSPILYNPYSVIVVSPSRFSGVRYPLAKKFADFLISPQGQDIIRNYGIAQFGVSLYFPIIR